jgi:hypothetical protein
MISHETRPNLQPGLGKSSLGNTRLHVGPTNRWETKEPMDRVHGIFSGKWHAARSTKWEQAGVLHLSIAASLTILSSSSLEFPSSPDHLLGARPAT